MQQKEMSSKSQDLLARPLFSGLTVNQRDLPGGPTCEDPDDDEEAEDPKEDGQEVDTGLLKALPAFAAARSLGLAAQLPLLDHKNRGQCRKEEHGQIMSKIKAYSVADASRESFLFAFFLPSYSPSYMPRRLYRSLGAPEAVQHRSCSDQKCLQEADSACPDRQQAQA